MYLPLYFWTSYNKYLTFTLFENHPKCPIGNTVWPRASRFKVAFLINFCLLKNVNVARFARNIEWDFFCNFQTLCLMFITTVCLFLLQLHSRMACKVSPIKDQECHSPHTYILFLQKRDYHICDDAKGNWKLKQKNNKGKYGAFQHFDHHLWHWWGI